MDNKKSKPISKLFKLKEWLTVPEAARHLSILFDEDVSEADVLRLALDKHIKLSVYFVNHARAKCGKVVSFDEVEYGESSFPTLLQLETPPPPEIRCNPKKLHKFIKQLPLTTYIKSLKLDDKRYLTFDKDLKEIRGVWDLSMIGNEQLDIEHEFQMLTDGPEVTLQGLDGAFVEREDGEICQLQESFDQNEYTRGSIAQLEKIKERITISNIGVEQAKELLDQHKKDREEYLNVQKKKDYSDDYYPASGLPKDSVLVVRTDALRKFELSLNEKRQLKLPELDKQENPKSKTSLLKIVIAMAVGGYGYDFNAKRSDIPSDILKDAEQLGLSIDTDTIRKWLKEASELLDQDKTT